MEPENGPLEEEIPFWKTLIFRFHLSFLRGGSCYVDPSPVTEKLCRPVDGIQIPCHKTDCWDAFSDTKCFCIHVHPKKIGSSYSIVPGFSNTSRPPHGRDNCSFSSWWNAFDSRAPVPTHQIPDTYEIYSYLLYQNFSAWWGRKAFTASNRWYVTWKTLKTSGDFLYKVPFETILVTWHHFWFDKLTQSYSQPLWMGRGITYRIDFGSLEDHLGHRFPPLPFSGSLRA